MVEKKIKGRKRHIVVDTMGNLLSVVVHAANIHDTKAGILAAAFAYWKYRTIKAFCGDDGYRKSFEESVLYQLGLRVDIVSRTQPSFEVLPVRWIVERTLAWLGNSRRLSKDYEISTKSEETFIMISHSRVLLRRLASL